LDAVKIRCRNRRTSRSVRRQLTWRQARLSSFGPLTPPTRVGGASSLSSGSGITSSFSSQAHLTASARFRARARWPDIRPVIHAHQLESWHLVVVSRCLSAAGVRFSVILARRGTQPSSRSACRTISPDLDGVSAFRTSELRSGWAPSVPRGQRCSSRTGATSRPASAASRRPVPALRHTSHRRRSRLTTHRPRVHTCSPVRSSPRL
jgi:hypothetical protein